MRRVISAMCGTLLALVLTSCLQTGQYGQTPAPSKQEEELVQFVLKEAIGQGKSNRLIAQIRKEGIKVDGPIDPQEAGILECWRYEKGQLAGCAGAEFLDSYERDTKTLPWKFSYVIFSITETDQAYTRATVRLDVVSGPKAGSGTILHIVRAEGEWKIESRERVWVS